MAEENQGQVPEEDVTDGQAPADDGQQGEALDAASLMAELKRVRRESARYRTQLRAFEMQAEEKAKAEMSEADRLKADLAKAQAALQERDQALAQEQMRTIVRKAALKAGFADTEDAILRIDVKQFEIDGDHADGLDEALEAILKAKPHLRGGQKTPAIPPTNPTGQRGLTKEDVRGMSADEINRRWDEVQKTLSA